MPLRDFRPGEPGSSGIPIVYQENLLDDPAYRTQVGFGLIAQLARGLPEVPDDGLSVCAACSAISLDDIKGAGYLHSESYHALSASVIRRCPLCLWFLQELHSHAGIGDPNQALVHLNPLIPDRAIKLRGVVDKDSGEIHTLNVRIENWLMSSPTAGVRAFALPGTSAARAGLGFQAPYGEEEKWASMRTWLERQTDGRQTTNAQGHHLPTRIIDVGENAGGGIRLVETASLPTGTDARYAALSYRWGDTNTLLTTRTNIGERLREIQSESMPKTIHNAVTATRRLGLRYLWVDCLCILQGDEEDWKKEAAGMGDVYMKAHCTLAIHSAKHANDGFIAESLSREQVFACGGHPDGRPFQFEEEVAALKTFQDSTDAKGKKQEVAPFPSDAFFVSKGSYARHHLDRSELSSRGWVLQERILSPRIIHFGPRGAVYFESRKGVEHAETGFEQNYRPFPRLRDALRRLDEGAAMPAPPEVVQRVYTDWYEVIMRYSTCLLSNEGDKFVALQGIAGKCEELTGDKLTDGLWRNTGGFCLLWLGQEGSLKRNTSIETPSWSWASVMGKIQFPHGTLALDMSNIAPEMDIRGVETAPGRASVLQLDNATAIATELRFMEGRVGIPAWDNMVLFVNLEQATRYWDVYDDDGRHLGWASLDLETRPMVDGLDGGIKCIKIASSRNDRIENGWDRGFLVLFVVFSSESGAWRRVGMGQILDRGRFRTPLPAMKLV